MAILVGEVIGVHGTKVTLKIFEDSSKETLFYDGDKFKGVSIREYLVIERGFREIVCIVEGEYLDEREFEIEGNRKNFTRKIEAKPIGYLENGDFNRGIKFLPMIKDSAYLLSEENVKKIYSRNLDNAFIVGTMLKEDIPISLPWSKLFNSHIGIFGNTGSGKSNTLAKLYTLLFQQKSQAMMNTSNFVILDFNGEYTNNQLTDADSKDIIKLDTHTEEDKFPLSQNEFWNSETLSILFQATTNTQKPFLNRVISEREKFFNVEDSLERYIKATFRRVFTAAQAKGETLNLIRKVSEILHAEEVSNLLRDISWNGTNGSFLYTGGGGVVYFNADGTRYDEVLRDSVSNIQLNNLSDFDELVIRANLKLIRDLIFGAVQFEHIQPLMKRIDSSLTGLKKILTLTNEVVEPKLLTVISLRKCNQEMKKILPLLMAKHFYHFHKNRVENPP